MRAVPDGGDVPLFDSRRPVWLCSAWVGRSIAPGFSACTPCLAGVGC